MRGEALGFLILIFLMWLFYMSLVMIF